MADPSTCIETLTWPGLNRRALAGTNFVSMYLHSSKKRGFSKWPKTLQSKEKTKALVTRLHFILSQFYKYMYHAGN